MRTTQVASCLAFACATSLVNHVAHANTIENAAATQISVGMPSGFADMAQNQRIVADVVFGTRRLGQFEIEAGPAKVRFIDPAAVAAAVPDLIDSPGFVRALTGDLDGNAQYVCATDSSGCERPRPEIAAVAFDTRRFRIELFVNPKQLSVQNGDAEFLKPEAGRVTLVDTVGFALSGSDGQSQTYSLRNRAILAIGEARLMSESFYSSNRGGDIDSLVAQLDRPNRRYSAGLFYTPGADLVGRRRLMGLGVGSQFDTHYDRSRLVGTPLVVFLQQRARVDLFVQGRLVNSSTFDAGNQMLDTANLPDGSYPIEIRVTEASGTTRSESRFFTKNSLLAPPGHIAFFANAGLMAADRDNSWLSVSRTPLLSAGASGRVGAHVAWDITTMATDRTQLVEVGGTYLAAFAQARIAFLGATGGNYGFVAQVGSTSASRLGFSFDLRKVHSGNGRPLIPLDDFTSDPTSVTDMTAQRLEAAGTSFTQIAGTLAYRVGPAQVAVSGLYRRDRTSRTSYAIGPSIHLPIVQKQQMRLTLNGNYLATERGRSFAFGVQFQLLGRKTTLSAQTGMQYDGRGDGRRLTELAELSGAIQSENVLDGDVMASAAIQRANGATLAQVTGDYRGPIGYSSASLLKRFATGGGSTQYALNLQTSLAVSGSAVRMGAKDQNDSVITVDLEGSAKTTPFEVFIDGAGRGTIRPGEHLTLALTPYRRYAIRMRPQGTDLVAYDAGERKVDVFPGTVARVIWRADTVLAMFGRLVRADGSPIANADIVTGDAISATDDNGYFQLQAPANAVLKVHEANGTRCDASIDASPSAKGYTALGDISCKI